MYIENHITADDHARCQSVPITPVLLAGAYTATLEAIWSFSDESLGPLFRGLLSAGPRETALLGLYYRMIGYCRTAAILNSVVHQQSLAQADRAVLELLVDVVLLHRNVIPDGVDRLLTVVWAHRLRAARRIRDYVEAHPEAADALDVESHREFIAQRETQVEADCARLWPTKGGGFAIPDHWSQLNLLDRAKRCGDDIELAVRDGYDMRNYFSHSGLAGVLHLDATAFETLCFLSIKSIAEGTLQAIQILGVEFHLGKAIPQFKDTVDDLTSLPHFCLVDQRLRALGEPAKVLLHRRAT